MTTDIEYALMAGVSYFDTRDPNNRFPTPLNWVSFNHQSRDSGFEAISFTNGTEIVISYAGTYAKDLSGDWVANTRLATGYGSAQLLQAAEYYLQVKALNPNATITLTGHSLGGGLAALIGVFFGVQANTFDQAPFANSAEDNLLTPDVADNLKDDLLAQGYSETALSGLTNFLQQRETYGGIPNSNLVTNINVQGEFLSGVPWNVPDRIGTTVLDIAHNAPGVSGTELHAQALLTAFLQSDATATTADGQKQSLSQVTYKLTDLLKMIFGKNLFWNDTDTDKKNLLDHLVRHEAGVQGAFVADQMLTRFAADLWKLAPEGGLTLTDGNPSSPDVHDISNALIAFAMQKYYEETDQSAGYRKELFTDLAAAGEGDNGIRFDMADVAKTFQTAFDNNQRLNLKDAKGFDRYFKYYLSSTNNFTLEEQQLINPILSTLRDWYVQAGSTGMNATDTQNRGAFLLGGTGQDTLTGGTAADLLVGNAGDDTLNGGAGNDTLLGGSGAGNDTLTGGKGNDYLEGGQGTDTYIYTSGDGLDTLLDTDHQGQIQYDTLTLNGGKKTSSNTYRNADGQFLYTLISSPGSPSLLAITGPAGNMLVWDFQSGDLNINLNPADALPPAQNILTGTENYDDIDSPTAQAIYGLGSMDVLSGHAGENGSVPNFTIYGGTGNDIIYGEYFFTGEYYRLGPVEFQTPYGHRVTLTGPGPSLYGEAGLDTLLGSLMDDTLDGGADPDYLHGYLGHDTLIGGTGNDILNGAEGRDALQGDDNDDRLGGGAGADVLQGGAQADWLYGDSRWLQPYQGWDGINYNLMTNQMVDVQTIPIVRDVLEVDAGDDMLFGGAGEDYLFGGAGNDYLDGGTENDHLQGEGGDDILSGGEGSDKLWGDSSTDALEFDAQIVGIAGTYTYYYRKRRVGLDGNDSLDGGIGDDQLWGGGGNDRLLGGVGSDHLYGGPGADILDGGPGSDDIYLDGNDKVILDGADFLHKVDGTLPIDLSQGFSIDYANGDISQAQISQVLGSDGRQWLSIAFDANNILYLQNGFIDDNQIFNVGADSLTQQQLMQYAPAVSLTGTLGNDTVYGSNNNDTLNGGAGNDTLDGQDGNDTLYGGTGSNTLTGGTGQDQLISSSHGDVLRGGEGDDLYTLAFGSDVPNGFNIVIDDAASTDALAFENVSLGINPITGLPMYMRPVIGSTAQDGNDLVLNIRLQDEFANTPDTLGTVRLTNYAGSGQIEQVTLGGESYMFVDPTTIGVVHNPAAGDPTITVVGASGAYIKTASSAPYYLRYDSARTYGGVLATLLSGSDANDFINAGSYSYINPARTYSTSFTQTPVELRGFAGNDDLRGGVAADLLLGGTGNDALYGFAGDDTYLFNRGDGLDAVHENTYADAGAGIDTLRFGAGISPTDITLSHDLIHAYVAINGTSDRITLNGWMADSSVELITFADGTVWDMAYLNSIIRVATTGDDYLSGGGGADTLDGLAGNDLIYGRDGDDTLMGSDGNDRLYGEAGNDILNGGSGDDSLTGGSGNDTYLFDRGSGIDWLNDEGGIDTVQFAPGILPGEITIMTAPNGISIRIASDQINVQDWYSNPVGSIEQILFSDGTVWDKNTISQRIQAATPSEAGDLIYGTPQADTIHGLGGDDELWGLGGDDLVFGENGNDIVYGGAGNDTLDGGAGNDYLEGDDGADVLIGGAGNDSLAGEIDNDRLDGGAGYDDLDGAEGSDTYVIYHGMGVDTIWAEDYYASPGDTIEFGSGITPENIRVDWGDGILSDGIPGILGIDIGNGEGVFMRDTESGHNFGIEIFRFADGRQYTLNQILALDQSPGGIGTQVGTSGDDVLRGGFWEDALFGGDGNDRIDGGDWIDYLDGGNGDDVILGAANSSGGDDYLEGGAGDDVLAGGANRDAAYGGQGNDTYLFNPGDGNNLVSGSDTISDGFGIAGEVDTLSIGGGVLPQQVLAYLSTYNYSSTDTYVGLVLQIGAPNDVVGIDWTHNYLDQTNTPISDVFYIERLQFLDNGNDQIFDLLALVQAREVDLRAAYDSNPANPSFIPLFLPGDLTAFDLTGTVPFAHESIAREYATTGTVSFVNTITGTDSVETLTGTAGDDTIQGLGGNDTLNGLAGNDSLDGGTGVDTMTGSTGNDTYIVDNTGDIVTESSSAGTDTVQSAITYTLGSNVEHLTLTGTAAINATGNTLANTLTGNSAANTLSGSAGIDTLYGMAGNDSLNGGTGADTLIGGLGDDTYTVDNTGDTVTELLNEGTDSVNSTITYTLGNHLENLILTGTAAINATGNTLNNTLTGNNAANILSGNAGDDTLSGGLGDDTLYGGDGNDTLDLGNASVNGWQTAYGDAGHDTLRGGSASSFLYGGDGNDTLTAGNGYSYLYGETGNDTLTNGAGGGFMLGGDWSGINSGDDILIGGSNVDYMYGGDGTDTLTGNAGDDQLNGQTGNDTLNGNAGTDTLNGGLGADVMTGGSGDDFYQVNDLGDTVTELLNEGTDSVNSTITYTLGNNVENLTLVGTVAINGTGNTFNNVLTGNSANNVLSGGAGNDMLIGGLGADSLIGGTGNDTYQFGVGYGLDTLTDNDATIGNTDTVNAGLNPLNLVFTKSGANLQMGLHGTADKLTVAAWYSGTANQTEVFKATDGSALLNTQVDQLIQAMAQFSANNGGITWDQAIDQRPSEVQAVLTAYWQAGV